jgi:hypothetical protein
MTRQDTVCDYTELSALQQDIYMCNGVLTCALNECQVTEICKEIVWKICVPLFTHFRSWKNVELLILHNFTVSFHARLTEKLPGISRVRTAKVCKAVPVL